MPGRPRTRICYVVSSPMTLRAFLMGHMRGALERHEVFAVANDGDPGLLEKIGLAVPVIPVAIERRISLFRDLCALFALWRIFRRERFDVVHSFTPKAGLLAAVAGWLAGVPVRLHTFTGQVWATRTGVSRKVLKTADRLTAGLATGLLADSPSQRDFLVEEGVVPARKIQVLGQGSVNGVDGGRFRPDARARSEVRSAAGVPEGAFLFAYVGRLARDKGLLDLAQAFGRIPEVWLLVVGTDEDRLAGELRAAAGSAAPRMRILDHTDRPEEVMAAADVFVLPSYREGFGSVILEAAAAGVPSVGTRVYGVTDAIVEGRTGLLVAPRDPSALAHAMQTLVKDPQLRLRLGEAARERVLLDFEPAALTRALLAWYDAMLAAKGGR